MQNENYSMLAKLISNSKNIVFFGGAGVSTESGIKDYRSRDGLYNTVLEYGISPEEILSISYFNSHPDVFYDFYRKYFSLDKVKPNMAHFALAKLEADGKLKAIITQNIDGLHQLAGSKKVLELHGTAARFYCSKCRISAPDAIKDIYNGDVPHCKKCKAVVRPAIVLYGEMLDSVVLKQSVSAIMNADLLIVGGTSLAVNPAASLIRYFSGGKMVLINKSGTPYDSVADLIIRDNIGEVFSEAMKLVE